MNLDSMLSQDNFHHYRNNLRDNYSEMEKYCSQKYGKGNFIDWLSNQIDLYEGNEEILKDLVSLDTIKDNNMNFKINPKVEQATNFLRKKLIDPNIESKYDMGESRAVLKILQQVRDNLTHHNKSEIDEKQYKRNYNIVKSCAQNYQTQ